MAQEGHVDEHLQGHRARSGNTWGWGGGEMTQEAYRLNATRTGVIGKDCRTIGDAVSSRGAARPPFDDPRSRGTGREALLIDSDCDLVAGMPSGRCASGQPWLAMPTGRAWMQAPCSWRVYEVRGGAGMIPWKQRQPTGQYLLVEK